MMNKKGTGSRAFFWTAVIGSLLIMVIITGYSVWTTRQTVRATDDAVSAVSSFYLEALADRWSQSISSQINDNFDMMDQALTFIQEEDVQSQDELRSTIGKMKSLLSLRRFALVDENNVVYTQYTTYTGGSRHPFLSGKQLNSRVVSIVTPYGSARQLCLAVPTPGFSLMGKSFKACFVQMDIHEIIDLLAVDEQERTYFGLYLKNGENISGTSLGSFIGVRNIFDAIRGHVPESIRTENQNRFAEGGRGSISYSVSGLEETLCYVPVQKTDLVIAVMIRESLIQEQIRHISEKTLATSRNQMLFTFVSVLLLATVLLIQFRISSRNRLEKEKEDSMHFRKMANTDALTGIRNKHAYTENEEHINQRISSGELKELAVAVCDINGLKYVNDHLGHSAGDSLIKAASSLICETFSHGAVFRIGGDEFAVLLQGEGYRTLQETVDALNRRVEANLRENKVVVAVGYAVLEPDDRLLQDVFERADQMMYERKSELKKMESLIRSHDPKEEKA